MLAKDDYIKIGDVANELLVHPQTLRNYDFRGILKPDLVTNGGTRYYKRETVDRFKEERQR